MLLLSIKQRTARCSTFRMDMHRRRRYPKSTLRRMSHRLQTHWESSHRMRNRLEYHPQMERLGDLGGQAGQGDLVASHN